MAANGLQKALRKAARGRFEDYEAIVGAVGPDAFRLARYMVVNVESAGDVCFGWLLGLHERLSSYDRSRPPQHWLVDELLRQSEPSREDRRSRRGGADLDSTCRTRLRDHTVRTINDLPRVYRNAFLMLYGLEWPPETIAPTLGMSSERCEQILARSRYFVTHKLQHFFLKPTSGSIPLDRGSTLSPPCRALRTHLAKDLSADPVKSLDKDLAAHLEECNDCHVETEIYRRVRLQLSTGPVPTPDQIWAQLVRYRARRRALDAMEGRVSAPSNSFPETESWASRLGWQKVTAAVLLLIAVAATVWYALAQAGP